MEFVLNLETLGYVYPPPGVYGASPEEWCERMNAHLCYGLEADREFYMAEVIFDELDGDEPI